MTVTTCDSASLGLKKVTVTFQAMVTGDGDVSSLVKIEADDEASKDLITVACIW